MNQDDLNKIMAGERISELERLRDELGTLKWTGADDGWDRAVEAVRKHIEDRQIALIHKYAPEAVMADVAGSA